ncbi:hypothetical protein Tco_1194757 [Tanacetum coccineum]
MWFMFGIFDLHMRWPTVDLRNASTISQTIRPLARCKKTRCDKGHRYMRSNTSMVVQLIGDTSEEFTRYAEEVSSIRKLSSSSTTSLNLYTQRHQIPRSSGQTVRLNTNVRRRLTTNQSSMPVEDTRLPTTTGQHLGPG